LASPLTPTELSPSAGKSITASIDNVFSWQSDGTQAGFYIEYARNVSAATVSNTGWITDSLSQHTFVGGTFADTYEYKWRVKVRNSAGQESLFSDWVVFKAGGAAGLTITFPANDLDVISAVPAYQHSYSNPDGYYQVAYEYFLFTGTTWDDFDALTAAQQESYTWDQLEALSLGNMLWDSGRVESTATSVEQPSDKLQVLQYWYKVRVKIWDNVGNELTSDIRTFGLLVESVPQIPTISVSPDSDNGRNAITITNPTPEVGQVAAHHNKLYRKKMDETWELIQDNILTGVGYDTACRSSKQEEYSASAVSADGIESSKSGSDYGTCQLNAYWFTNLSTLATVKLKAEARWGKMQSERSREEQIGMDEQYPSVNYESQRFYRGSFQALVFRPTDGSTWQEYTEQIRAVLDPDTYSPIIMRTPFGDLLKVNVYDFKVGQDDRIQQTRKISFSFVEVEDLMESVTNAYDTPDSLSDCYWVVDPTTGEGYGFYAEPEWGDMSLERDRVENIGLNSIFPSSGYGNKKAYRGGFSGLLMKPSSGILAEQVMILRNFIDGTVKKPLLFYMTTDKAMYVDIYGFSFELFDRIDQARKISFEFVEVEEVL